MVRREARIKKFRVNDDGLVVEILVEYFFLVLQFFLVTFTSVSVWCVSYVRMCMYVFACVCTCVHVL